MADIHPFRSWRFDLGQVGDLSEVVAPPVDLIEESDVRDLYRNHPCNVIRLVRNRDEPADTASSRLERMQRYFRQWTQDGILNREHEDTIYVYHQTTGDSRGSIELKGFVATVPLEAFAHVEDGEPEEDATAYFAQTSSQFGPLLATFDDPKDSISSELDAATLGITAFELVDENGTTHRFWPVSNYQRQQSVIELLRDQQLGLSRGKQQLLVARKHRNKLSDAGELGKSPGAERVMVYCVENLMLEQEEPDGAHFADRAYRQCLSGLFIYSLDE
ncbi:MAG: hypothetical protein CMJ78_21085 [Planctomycetaceae bacterium]|nr:hypothetical protein [Planctomycetaceae bacterium]